MTQKKSRNSTTASVKADRHLKTVRKRINSVGRVIIKHCNRFIVQRRDNLLGARTPVVVWILIISSLITLSVVQNIIGSHNDIVAIPAAGGAYTEGVIDKITSINPIYATTDSEKAASSLVYSSLVSYDTTGKLRGKLANNWTVSPDGKLWTIKLRNKLKWSDNTPLTADDVAYTLKLIKTPEINSPLIDNWKNVTVKVKDPTTIELTTPTPYLSLPNALTFGILPKHILASKSAADITTLSTKAPQKIIGSGAFKLRSVETRNKQTVWSFVVNPYYYGVKPLLQQIAIRIYPNQDAMLDGLKKGEVNAASNINIDKISQFSNSHHIVQLDTTDGVFAIFNNSSDLLNDPQLRSALSLGVDRAQIIQQITAVNGVKPARPLNTPLANGVYQSVDQLKQPEFNRKLAEDLLDKAGWVRQNGSDYRVKGNRTLQLNIVAIKSTSYAKVADLLVKAWRELGVDAKVTKVDTDTAQQSTLSPRNYDVLVYQYHLGADPDQYSYWAGKEASDTGLNYANYKSKRADVYLANGRSAINAQKRESSYLAFAKQWLHDVPAIALYQPSVYFAVQKGVNTLQNGGYLTDIGGRFYNISTWTVRSSAAMTTP